MCRFPLFGFSALETCNELLNDSFIQYVLGNPEVLDISLDLTWCFEDVYNCIFLCVCVCVCVCKLCGCLRRRAMVFVWIQLIRLFVSVKLCM